MNTKEELRRKYRVLRSQLSQEELENQNLLILQHFSDFFKFLDGISHVHLFLPIKRLNEVNTFPILNFLNEQGVVTYTSITDETNRRMLTVEIGSETAYEFDGLGIPVPINPVVSTNAQIQMVLVPLLAIDLQGHRLGYGKGYYDNFLSDLDQAVHKVGVGFFEPESFLPYEDHDIALDFYISPKGYISFP